VLYLSFRQEMHRRLHHWFPFLQLETGATPVNVQAINRNSPDLSARPILPVSVYMDLDVQFSRALRLHVCDVSITLSKEKNNG
jgi:hypothetical protein